MTLWIDPNVLLMINIVVTDVFDCGALGTGIRGIGTDKGETSGSESISILSYFE